MAASGGTGAPSARAAIQSAVLGALAKATLEDVSRFVTYDEISRRAHVSKGTVTYHFASRGELLDELLAGVLAAVLTSAPSDFVLPTLGLADPSAAAAGSADQPPPARDPSASIDRLAHILVALDATIRHTLEAPVGEGQRMEDIYGLVVAMLSLTAPNDEASRQTIATLRGRAREWHVRAARTLAELTDRSWRSPDAPEEFGMMVGALFDGFVVGRRADPEAPGWGAAVRGWMRLFMSFTDSLHDDDQGGVERLLATAAGTTPDPADRAEIAAAAARVYARDGWRGLTLAAVAVECARDPQAVGAAFRGRRGLASAVWLKHVPTLERAAATVLALPDVERALRAYLEAFVGIARSDPDLTSAFLNDVLRYSVQHGAPVGHPDDPRSHAPLPEQIAKVLEAYSGELRVFVGRPDVGPAIRERELDGAYAVTPEQAAARHRSAIYQRAVLISNATLLMCITRPAASVADVVDAVMDSAVHGILRS